MSCSLIAGSLCFAVDYGQAVRDLHRAKTEGEKRQVLKRLLNDGGLDSTLSEQLDSLLAGDSWAITVRQAEAMVELRAFVEQTSPKADAKDAAAKAKKIKENPLYRDPGDKEQSNWFAKGFEKIGEVLGKILEGMFRSDRDNANFPNIQPPSLGWLRFLLWGVFGALVLGFIYFAARHFSWKKGLERRAKAVLSEDEPELSRDEYLAEADRLIQEGKYREAVRYLYLACLLLFDENGVARFIRGQTNWEHLARIEASANMPADLEFRSATQKFDVVWYGMRVQGQPDVDAMRHWYVQVSEQLRRKAA